jgi:hypothetical protein
MLHDWNSLIWNQKDNVCECYMTETVQYKIKYVKMLNMKSKGKYVCECYMTETVQYEIKWKCLCKYVTWLKQLNMKSKGKCLCECYMTEIVQYVIKWKCLCKCYMIETV